jgi:hypothetical protein
VRSLLLLSAILIQGASHQCDCRSAEPQEVHSSWSYPRIVHANPATAAAVNQAIAANVRKALELKTLSATRRCKCRRSGLILKRGDRCETKLQSESYVALRCGLEVSLMGKAGTTYRSLHIQLDGDAPRVIATEELFRGPTAVKVVTAMLAAHIRDDHEAAAPGDPNANISEDEIPQLSEQMFRSGVLVPGGVRFIVTGSHHSAFETIIDVTRLRPFLAARVLRDIAVP